MTSEANKKAFRDSLASGIDKYVKQQGRNTFELNCRTDSACEGYVRVPGPHACDFCVTMGASDNFYHTQESAGGGVGHGSKDDLYHPYCNCTVAAVFRRRGELVARDPETGDDMPYDGASIVQRYREAGSPTFRKNRQAEAERRRIRRRNGEVPATRGKRNAYAGARLSDADFDAAMKSLAEARSVDELHVVAERIVAEWPKNANGRNKAQWGELSKFAKSRKKELGSDGVLNHGKGQQSKMTKAWGERLAQREYEKTGRHVGSSAGLLGRSIEIDSCKSFDELQDALIVVSEKAYVTKGVRELDFEAVRPFVSSFVGSCQKMLGINPRISQIRVHSGEAAVMLMPNSNGTFDLVLSRGFFSSVESAEAQYSMMVDLGLSAEGTTFATMGVHEAAHVVEVIVAFNECRSPIQAKQLLKTQRIGERIVRKAVARYNKVSESAVTADMMARFKKEFSDSVSISIGWSVREAPCEAVQDIDANGQRASVLSWCLMKAMKEVFDEATASYK